MKIRIPKRPKVPYLSNNEIQHISEIVFGNLNNIQKCDGIFIFGGTHPRLWKSAIYLYQREFAKLIFVTGGNKRNRETQKHKSWNYGEMAEADVIRMKLIKSGIPENSIFFENKSINSYENVDFIKGILIEKNIKSLILISKNYGVGRQKRTFKKLVHNIDTFSYGIETGIDSQGYLNKYNWFKIESWKSCIYGEYLRNVYYSRRGDIIKDFDVPPSLKIKIMNFIPQDYIL